MLHGMSRRVASCCAVSSVDLQCSQWLQQRRRAQPLPSHMEGVFLSLVTARGPEECRHLHSSQDPLIMLPPGKSTRMNVVFNSVVPQPRSSTRGPSNLFSQGTLSGAHMSRVAICLPRRTGFAAGNFKVLQWPEGCFPTDSTWSIAISVTKV